MELNPFALYKVVEIGKGIAIINSTSRSKDPEATELIVADPSTCTEYLTRYVAARCQHRNVVEAHMQAISSLPMAGIHRHLLSNGR